jgi:uncharacterized protein YndB with AHSA1/START domain
MPADSDRTLTTTVLLNAPVQAVYAAWTQPDHMRHWFGPKGFTVFACEMDARPGGHWRVGMTAPEGTRHVVSELLQHARPHFDALRAQAEAKPKPDPKKSDA